MQCLLFSEVLQPDVSLSSSGSCSKNLVGPMHPIVVSSVIQPSLVGYHEKPGSSEGVYQREWDLFCLVKYLLVCGVFHPLNVQYSLVLFVHRFRYDHNFFDDNNNNNNI